MKKLLLVILLALAACGSQCEDLAKPDLVHNKQKAQRILAIDCSAKIPE
jgi:hypothetical protein